MSNTEKSKRAVTRELRRLGYRARLTSRNAGFGDSNRAPYILVHAALPVAIVSALRDAVPTARIYAVVEAPAPERSAA